MIHVWLNNKQNSDRVWNTADSKWTPIESLASLETLPFIKSNDKDICLYLPTQSVLSLVNDLSSTQLKQLGKSGQQYLFEDLSLTSVEQLQVRYINESFDNYFYALADAEIEKWQNSLALVGYKLTSLLPDFVLLPSPDARLDHQLVLYQQGVTTSHSSSSEPLLSKSLSSEPSADSPTELKTQLDTEGSLLARFSEAHGTAISHWTLLPRLLDNIEEVIYIHDRSQETPSYINQNLKQLFDKTGIVVTNSSSELTPLLTPNKHPLNFIEVKRHKLASPYLTIAAGIFVLAGITQISADILQRYTYEKVATVVTNSTNEQFASWFLGESLNSRVSVTNQVKPRLMTNHGGAQEQVTLMSQLTPLIKQSQLVAQSLSWNDKSLNLVVKGQNREGVDNLQQKISSLGWNATLGTVRPSVDGGVIAEFNIPISVNDLSN